MPPTAAAAAPFLRALLDAALAAAGPEGKFAPLPAPPTGRTIVLGAGKAAARMAAALEAALEAAGWPHAPEGLVVTRYGHGWPTRHVEAVEAAHPTPDAAGRAAAERILALAQSARAEDLVIALVSGGASALMAAPAPGVAFEEKRAVNRRLLVAGAPIAAMNRVRQAMSAVKGGRLAAAAAPARLVTYAISDVPGDDPATIGSGPTVPLAAGEDPLALCARYGVELSSELAAAMRANPAPAVAPTPVRLIATPQAALEAAAAAARAAGVAAMILGDAIEGEAREVATVMAGIARQVLRHGQPAPRPVVLLSGGETTVTVSGKGRGGRNAEFLLALALALGPDLAEVAALAADTDGIDGVESNAGALIGPATAAAVEAAGRSLRASLEDNDAFGLFEAIGALVVTGPTRTNVNDFRAIYIA